MQSKIAESIHLKHQPVALVWSDQKPENAAQFKENKWGCIMWLIAASAAKGKTSVCNRQTFGCVGGAVGMGFGDQYKNFPGGEECFCYFLSIGNENWEQGRKSAEKVKPFMREQAYDEYLRGERYIKSPELVKKVINCMPITDIPSEYVVFKPLREVNPENEKPKSVTFFADPDQLSALVVLANYGREDNENVTIPYAAGCQTIGIYSYKEAEAEKQRAVVGLTDLTARVNTQKQLGDNFMSFTMPLAMFEEMEANVEGSFLERHIWQSLLKKKMK
ncbi:MAG: DUF169 domain-containing protein [Desulfobacteraceae bacterium]|nr:DUF169 domain-containing protein [Desulfobacteraceae bacterium]